MVKKRLNVVRKGKNGERELAKVFKMYLGPSFERVPASGARPKQVQLNKQAMEVFTGDLTTPDGFRFSIECKSENVTINWFEDSAKVDSWIKQAVDDAKSVGKSPMVCWKMPRRGWIVIFARNGYAPSDVGNYVIYKGKWFVCRLEKLLEVTKSHPEFWFPRTDHHD